MIEQLESYDERPSKERPFDWLREVCDGSQLIVLANREPYTHEHDGTGRPVARHSSSGVVNAVEPLISACGGVWIAHGSGAGDRETSLDRDGLYVPPGNPQYRLRRVWLNAEEEQGYYYGFANEALWPLCHRAHVCPIFRTDDLENAWVVSARFADTVCDEAMTDTPVVLVQDYHFALAPLIIRERLPQSTVVTFWHVPWPDWQTFAICPWRHQILESLLRSSVVGFQTATDCRNFIDTVEHTLEVRFDREDCSIICGGRRVLVRAYPASVDWRTEPAVEDTSASVRDLLGLDGDVRLGVGVDRLDYTKGIEEKFLAIEQLLDTYPEFAGRFVFIQLAEPSRTQLPPYAGLRMRVRATAERINRRFGTPDYCPIVFLEGQHTPSEISRFMRAADLCYVGSLHDGMNLVSKEFARSRDDERGVLVLSEFAGAARELSDAVIVNPYDIAGSARALAIALTMSAEEQGLRMKRMRHTLASYDAHRWAADILTDAARLRRQRPHGAWSDAVLSAAS
ncbi:MAG: alpha,alpha-trehalose-phosphate synthase (UDP-forming) [Vicinamibacterales bacterium]